MRQAMSERAWARVFVLAGLAAAALCAIFILDYTGYPYATQRLFIFSYLFRLQDLPATALVAGLAVAACVPGLARPAQALVEAAGQHPWRTAAVAFVTLAASQLLVVKDFPLAGDEHLVLLQAKAFAAGHLTARFPPELLTWVVPWPYVNRWLYASLATGQVVSVYWPGFALLLAPFVLLGATWACNALLASGSLVLVGASSRSPRPASPTWPSATSRCRPICSSTCSMPGCCSSARRAACSARGWSAPTP
jgi:hypothetical protein